MRLNALSHYYPNYWPVRSCISATFSTPWGAYSVWSSRVQRYTDQPTIAFTASQVPVLTHGLRGVIVWWIPYSREYLPRQPHWPVKREAAFTHPGANRGGCCLTSRLSTRTCEHDQLDVYEAHSSTSAGGVCWDWVWGRPRRRSA